MCVCDGVALVKYIIVLKVRHALRRKCLAIAGNHLSARGIYFGQPYK